MKTFDIICVGGGIGGSGCATVLARAGLDVLVLEPTTEFPDLVRGEWFSPWGVAEIMRTGLFDDLVAAGGFTVTQHYSYDETMDPKDVEATPLPLHIFRPEVTGPLTIRHPDACQALFDAATKAGATTLRGATNIEVRDRVVTYAHDGATHDARARLIIGADGRGSPLRTALGIELEKSDTQHILGGLLVEGLDWLRDDTEMIATEKGRHVLLFPQGGGRARLYLMIGLEERDAFAGADKAKAYLDAFVMDCWPESERFPSASIIGPANAYRSVDTWTPTPYKDGVVLVGDAAGYNDPIIGQGLSITSRDTRIVTEAILANTSGDWGAETFEDYATERVERMRRLRLNAKAYEVVVGGRGIGRDPQTRRRVRELPQVMMVMGTSMFGPDMIPEAAFDEAELLKVLTTAN